jgi:hypothetical protein
MKNLLIAVVILLFFASCSNKELKDEVQEYCSCLQKNIGDDLGRIECIDLMDSIQKKYKNKPRLLEKIREETMLCN